MPNRWMILSAFFVVACGSGKAPAPSPAAPVESSTPGAAESSTPEPETAASTSASAEMSGEQTPAPAAEGPKADNPARTTVTELSPDNPKQLPNGFYFIEGTVTRLPCNACSVENCKMGETCHTKPCMYCNATVLIQDGSDDITIDHPDRDNVPPYRLGERVRIVLEKRGLLRLAVRKSKPCPPSECLDVDPPKHLKKAPKGVDVRKDGDRCYAAEKCPANAKCKPDAEVRVRCP